MTTYTYDTHGNRINETSIHDGDTYIRTYRYKYEGMNRIVEKVVSYHSADLKFKQTTAYRYNSNGQLVQEFGKEWPTLKVTITYDQHGNWIRRLSKYGNSPLPSVDERVIEYY